MEGILVPISLFLGAFAMVFGLRYLANKENMAMIQNGMDPKANKPLPQPYRNLKWGLLLVGVGIGLFLAFVLDNSVFIKAGDFNHRGDNVPIYFSLIGIFGGLGLLISYFVEKKELDRQELKSDRLNKAA
jgi:uncharacterized oligopeptide transporter (OPT) family protein